jgi:hypothetical protein
MNFTFAITTDYKNPQQLSEVISSIRSQNIENYEILVIGGQKPEDEGDLSHIFFDETQQPGWITRKKNTLCQAAKYDNIVLMHDYFVFDIDWYSEFVKFGDDWYICSNAQYLINGERHFTDWVTWDDPIFPRYTALPYDEWSRTEYQYMSGGYFLVKKQVALDNPFNEFMLWGSAEDVEWSLRVRNKYKMKCNGQSIVRHNKVHRDAK